MPNMGSFHQTQLDNGHESQGYDSVGFEYEAVKLPEGYFKGAWYIEFAFLFASLVCHSNNLKAYHILHVFLEVPTDEPTVLPCGALRHPNFQWRAGSCLRDSLKI